jgi:hypothetical protein
MSQNRNRLLSRLLRPLASLKLTVIALLLLALMVGGGTVYQASRGLSAAQTEIFSAWIIWLFGIIPLPGLRLVSALLFLNLLAAVILRLEYRWRQSGLLLIHFGLLLLIASGFFISFTAQEYFLTLGEGESSRIAHRGEEPEAQLDRGLEKVILPFEIKLLDFAKSVHPGTDIPRSFTSRVEIVSGSRRRRAVIAMNRPLRFREYTLYQSSYGEDGLGRESSTFAVVRNWGRWLPYIASILIFFGLAGHFLGMLAAALKKPRSGKGQP